MTVPSESFYRDTERFEDRAISRVEQSQPVPGPGTRFDSTVIVGLGGPFRDTGPPYSPHIDISEDEDGARPSSLGTTVGPGEDDFMLRLGRPAGPPHSRSTPIVGAHRPANTSRLNSLPYLRREDFQSFLERRDRRYRSRRGTSSDTYTRSSEYYSAADCPAQSVTEATEHGDGDDEQDEDDENSSSASPPYFTPGHTPPPVSEGTGGQPESEHMGPTSPSPFSTYSLYNAEHGENAIAQFD